VVVEHNGKTVFRPEAESALFLHMRTEYNVKI